MREMSGSGCSVVNPFAIGKDGVAEPPRSENGPSIFNAAKDFGFGLSFHAALPEWPRTRIHNLRDVGRLCNEEHCVRPDAPQ